MNICFFSLYWCWCGTKYYWICHYTSGLYRKNDHGNGDINSHWNAEEQSSESKHWFVDWFRTSSKSFHRLLVGIYRIILSWFPTAAQSGPQGFCAGAVDNTNVQSDPWCITFLVGYKSPDIIRPTAVQGSASPLGTIMQNHTVFSIQSTHHSLAISCTVFIDVL